MDGECLGRLLNTHLERGSRRRLQARASDYVNPASQDFLKLFTERDKLDAWNMPGLEVHDDVDIALEVHDDVDIALGAEIFARHGAKER